MIITFIIWQLLVIITSIVQCLKTAKTTESYTAIILCTCCRPIILITGASSAMHVNGYVSTLENVHIISVFIQTLTSQNSPSSYSASSLKGSKNGCLTIIPKET